MSQNTYIIDTCSLTALHRVYPADIFKPVWDKIECLIDEGALISCEDVFIELEAQDDELHDWAKQQKEKGFFWPLTTDIQERTKEVLKSHTNLLDLKKRKSSADAFLIALALIRDATVVSEEKPSGGPEKSKIPDVCAYYSIRCISLIEMLRDAGFRLQ